MALDLLKDGRGGASTAATFTATPTGLMACWSPEEVVGAYREAGYDFICLSDHFEEEYGREIADTRQFRDDDFTTILGAELSSAPWNERLCYWVVAAGLPADFEPPPAGDHAEAISRARDVGAFVVMLHPGINNLPLAAADGLPGLDAVHAVEVYNHNAAMAAIPDRDNGAYMLEGLLEGGRKVLVSAADDAHWGHPRDRFGGWVEVWCDRLDPGGNGGVPEGRPLLLDAGARVAGDDPERRTAARGDERGVRDLADHGRRSVAERSRAPRRRRRADHRSGVRSGAVPRLLLPGDCG